MTSVVLNEYLHVRFVMPVGDDDHVSVVYEPLAHNPVAGVDMAAFFLGFAAVYEIVAQQGVDEARIHLHDNLGDATVTCVWAAFHWETGTLVVRWSEDPGEHFLTANYEYDDAEEKSPAVLNWMSVGF